MKFFITAILLLGSVGISLAEPHHYTSSARIKSGRQTLPNTLNLTGNPGDIAQMEALIQTPKYVAFINERIKNAAQKINVPAARAKFENMSFPELYAFWTESFPMSATELAQVLSTLEVEGASAFGERHPYLCQLNTKYAGERAEGHATLSVTHQLVWNKYMNFRHEFRKPGDVPKHHENEAVTRRAGSDLMTQGRECMRMYRHSDGHWAQQQNFHALACHDMKPHNGYKCVSKFVNWGPSNSNWE